MARCQACGVSSPVTAAFLRVCGGCAHSPDPAVRARVAEVHRWSRRLFGLPEEPPRAAVGVTCRVCLNRCRIPPGGRGYCGLRTNVGGRLVGGRAADGRLSWYHDPLPTNCVAAWVCPAGTGAGYPHFARTPGPEYGYRNLAVFYEACSFNCLFCQNWHFRGAGPEAAPVPAAELAGQADPRTTCICFFGGDPSPQIFHSLRTGALARRAAAGRVLRICWETNGSMDPRLQDAAMEMALATGGCVKFDLKAWDENLHVALTGAPNAWTLENFRRAARLIPRRPDPPPLVASTLLIPGYVDAAEVAAIARFLAGLDPDLPYSLLAFAPGCHLSDLRTTSSGEAEEAQAAARGAGLRRVHLGNRHLLDAVA